MSPTLQKDIMNGYGGYALMTKLRMNLGTDDPGTKNFGGDLLS